MRRRQAEGGGRRRATNRSRSAGRNTVSVLLGNGDGTFQPQQTYGVGSSPSSVAVGDLGNGHLDLVVANQGANTVSVLLAARSAPVTPAPLAPSVQPRFTG